MKTWLGAFVVLSITAGSPVALAAPRHGPVIVITQKDLLQVRTASVETPRRPSVLVITQKDLALDEETGNRRTLDTAMVQVLPPLVTPPRTVSLKIGAVSPVGPQPGPAALQRSPVKRPALRRLLPTSRFLRRAVRTPKHRDRSRLQRLGPFAVQ